jgi:hypothetical protein
MTDASWLAMAYPGFRKNWVGRYSCFVIYAPCFNFMRRVRTPTTASPSAMQITKHCPVTQAFMPQYPANPRPEPISPHANLAPTPTFRPGYHANLTSIRVLSAMLKPRLEQLKKNRSQLPQTADKGKGQIRFTRDRRHA